MCFWFLGKVTSNPPKVGCYFNNCCNEVKDAVEQGNAALRRSLEKAVQAQGIP
jgi:hypothetical protein